MSRKQTKISITQCKNIKRTSIAYWEGYRPLKIYEIFLEQPNAMTRKQINNYVTIFIDSDSYRIALQ